jgi:tetratricopeptide (TPR) repeat protein
MRKQIKPVALSLLCIICCPAVHSYAQQEAVQYQNQAASMLLNHEYESAITQLRQAAHIYKSDQQWHLYFSCLNQITTAYLKLNQFELAKKMAKEALWESILQLGRNNEESARAAHQLAEVYSQAGRYEKAAEFHQMGLTIRRILYEETHPDIAASYRELAKNYQRQADYTSALSLYQQALEINESLFGASHPTTAENYTDLAKVSALQSKDDQAIEYYSKALEALHKSLGSQHPKVARVLYDLSLLYQASGDEKQSADYLQRAAAIYHSEDAAGSTTAANVLFTYAHTLVDQGLTASASPYLLNAAAIFQNSGATTEEAGRACFLAGIVLFHNNQYTRAAEHFKKSVKSSYNNPISYQYLISCLIEAGKEQESLKWCREYIANATLPSQLGDAQLQMGKTLYQLGKTEEAYQALNKALPLLSRTLWQVDALLLQSQIHLGRKEYQDALRIAEKAIKQSQTEQGLPSLLLSISATFQYAKISTLLAQQDRNKIENLTNAHLKYEQCTQLIAELLDYPLSAHDLKMLIELNVDVYEYALGNAYQLLQQTQQKQYKKSAFAFMEYSKAFERLLWEKYSRTPQTNFSLSRLKQAYDYTGFQGDFRLNLEEKKATTTSCSVHDVLEIGTFMSYLGNDIDYTLSYFYGKKSLYILSTTNRDIQFFRIALDSDPGKLIETFQAFCNSPPESYSQEELQRSFFAYQDMNKPLLQSLIPYSPQQLTNASVLFLPHGPLHTFPFEALSFPTEHSKSFNTTTYLGTHVHTVYNFSASSYISQKPPSLPNMLSAFFPESTANHSRLAKTISNSTTTGQEVAGGLIPLIEKWVSGTGGILIDNQESLADLPPDCALIHPATAHAFCLNSTGHIYPVNALEQALPLKSNQNCLHLFPSFDHPVSPSADISSIPSMAVSCTAPSMLFHRWQPSAPGQTVFESILEEIFHHEQAPSNAIQHARKHYLGEIKKDAQLAHPYYWAGYCFVGKLGGETYIQKSTFSPYAILAAMSCIIVLAFWLRKR